MIHLAGTAEFEPLASFCRQSLFGARIASFAESYGMDYDFAEFWLQRTGARICAAFARIDHAMTVYAVPEFDAEEAAHFLSVVGYQTLFCAEETAKAMQLSIRERGPVLCHNGAAAALRDRPPTGFSFSESPLPQALFPLLAQVGMLREESRMSWITDVSHRIRHGTARAVSLLLNGQPVSCAMEVARTPDCAMIGAVATHPQYRGLGCGGWLVSRLTRDALTQGKSVFLCREADTNEHFYQSLGFDPFGHWAVC